MVFAKAVVLMATTLAFVQSQRLSQGASDWYMRFHSYDFVKRNVERPVTHSFTVSSVVKNRYAVTTVRTVVGNPANVEQQFVFGFVLPEAAFVSDVAIERSGPNDVGGKETGKVRAQFNASNLAIDKILAEEATAASANGHPVGVADGGHANGNGNGAEHDHVNGGANGGADSNGHQDHYDK